MLAEEDDSAPAKSASLMAALAPKPPAANGLSTMDSQAQLDQLRTVPNPKIADVDESEGGSAQSWAGQLCEQLWNRCTVADGALCLPEFACLRALPGMARVPGAAPAGGALRAAALAGRHLLGAILRCVCG